jgi:cell division protein FtsQ
VFKKVFKILIWIVVLAGIVSALAFMQNMHKKTICQGFELSITDENTDRLIDEESIRRVILQATDTLIGKPLGEIDLKYIYQVLQEIPFVRESDIQTSISGYIDIEIELRRAIIRVVNKKGINYYIDNEGWLLPVNPGFPSRVIVANGNINDGISGLEGKKVYYQEFNNHPVLAELFSMASYIDQSPFLSRMISQVWVNRQGDYELIPMVGNYVIKFGDEKEMKDKFDKLVTFYREGAGKAGWIDYKSVDLRYKNQIICSKK